MSRQSELVEALRAEGLTVKLYEGWETRGGSWAEGAPIGLMEHHTAPPLPYPVDELAGDDSDGQIKANANTKADGTIWLLAYEACNYSSGSGSSIVLAEARRGDPPSQNAKERGLEDDTNGNPYFWNFENDHAGDGSPIPAVQLEAIQIASRIVAEHFGLSWQNTISHAEWTARKGDPYWNGSRRAIEEIRAGMEALVSWKSKDGYTYTDTEDWPPHENGIKWAIDSGLMLGDRTRGKSDARFNAQDDISRGEIATTLKRFTDDASLADEIAT